MSKIDIAAEAVAPQQPGSRKIDATSDATKRFRQGAVPVAAVSLADTDVSRPPGGASLSRVSFVGARTRSGMPPSRGGDGAQTSPPTTPTTVTFVETVPRTSGVLSTTATSSGLGAEISEAWESHGYHPALLSTGVPSLERAAGRDTRDSGRAGANPPQTLQVAGAPGASGLGH